MSSPNLGPLEQLFHELHHPSVKEQSQQATDTEAPTTVREVLMIEADWRTQFIDFIKEFKLPPHVDHKSAEAGRIIRPSKGFVLIGDNLYKHSASGILMKCVTLEEGRDISRRYMNEFAAITPRQGH